jgi:predicted CXXCH cytochrome family protein
MSLRQRHRLLLIGGWVCGLFLLFAASSFTSTAAHPQAPWSENPDDYVGTETCKTCHESEFKGYATTKHAKMALHATPGRDHMQGCESCHGPGKAHVEGGGDKSKIVTFHGMSSKEISETCLGCHARRGDEHTNFRRGEHWRNDIGCTDCHAPHSSVAVSAVERATLIEPHPVENPKSPATVPDPADMPKATSGDDVSLSMRTTNELMLKATEPELCLKCHSEVKAQFSMPFRHKVLEGAVKCSDCHSPHGGFEQKQTRLAAGSEVGCVKCHTDKQGPFAFEHAPVKLEGCAICHSPHGSSNPKLLKRNQMRQLCLECHSDILGKGAPNTPSFHNQAVGKYQNCTTCHTHIHGSMSDPLFFR